MDVEKMKEDLDRLEQMILRMAEDIAKKHRALIRAKRITSAVAILCFFSGLLLGLISKFF